MISAFAFAIIIQAVLYVTCSGEYCSKGWSTETTQYRILNGKNAKFVHVSCRQEDFKVDGQKILRCISGQLPTFLPECVPYQGCTPLQSPLYGSVKCSDTAPDMGSSCVFRCQGTHYLRGSHTRTCAENLRWTGSQTRCLLKPKCPVPPELLHGSVIGCSPQNIPRYNDICYFRCNDGFELEGSSNFTCRLHGKLADVKGIETFPKCVSKTLESGSNAQLHGNNGTQTATCGQLRGKCKHFCKEESGIARCICLSGYKLQDDGVSCEKTSTTNPSPGVTSDVNDSRNKSRPVSPTSWVSCKHHNGYCSDYCYPDIKGVRCSCRSGYKLSRDNKTCIEKRPEDAVTTGGYDDILTKVTCRSFHRYCSQRCHEELNGVRCSCYNGFQLSRDGRTCIETRPEDPATTGGYDDILTKVTCQSFQGYCSQLCHEELNGVRCSCYNGFQLSRDGRTCIDVDECADSTLNKCDHNCDNTNGGYSCSCKAGYVSLDGFKCEDVNECADKRLNKCTHGCENTVGGYRCNCDAGYVSPDGIRCEACRENSYRTTIDLACKDCPANSRTGGEGKKSVNDCICNPGFTGNPGQGIPCRDIDECADENKFGCSHICINTPGSAHCACPQGYQLNEDQKTCIDIDECSIKNGGCDGICHNTLGNFTCSCPVGYISVPHDRYRCNDVDECAENNGGCSDKCVNFVGGFHCICPEGYHLHPDGKNCIPVYCPRVHVPHHSTLRCRNNRSSPKETFHPGKMPEDIHFPSGAICRVKCDTGYDLASAQPAIFCQNDGKWNASLPECKVLHCPPLEPPLNGDVYPASCKEGTPAVKQKCVFTCKSGYRITGQEVLTCHNNLTWSKKNLTTKCVAETELSISCPDDDITIELMEHEGWAELQLNSPRTSLEAGLTKVSPSWVTLDGPSVFPAGETEVTFSVIRPGDNKTAECSITVVVLDKHPPVFSECPDTVFVTSSIAATEVDWKEPVPEDNVGIASVSKTLEPNSTLSPGIHFVEYVARDFAGNVGQCMFQINVTGGGCKDLADPENGEANCVEWTFGKICQPTCFDNYDRPPELFACDESGTWTPTDFISPCLPECPKDKTWSPELEECVYIS